MPTVNFYERLSMNSLLNRVISISSSSFIHSGTGSEGEALKLGIFNGVGFFFFEEISDKEGLRLGALLLFGPLFRKLDLLVSFLISTTSFCNFETCRLSLSISCSLSSRFLRSRVADSTRDSLSF